ncbi:MAG TPA: M23 family metallopeptidase [Candidatus Peribacteraceae bacterium]|nr:M23 family metallopeptidase [Candidatus Peribacteraceae bacterium]
MRGQKVNIRIQRTPLHRVTEPSPWQFLRQRSSFWFATITIFAFVIGNMLGQHGWHTFWASVIGREEIVYDGVVTPIALVPDYVKWARYGGDPHLHTFKQVPQDALVPLPPYNAAQQNDPDYVSPHGQIYSVGHLGSYTDGGDHDGAHVGVDIRVPVGTPVRAIANGIVRDVRDDAGGFGILVVIEHPNVPDPKNPKTTTSLFSIYAHLSATLIAVGDVVSKGEQIALSGQTGFASGPHLHFQIDNAKAPWHPYWPFSTSEARSAGMSFTQAINAGLHSERGQEYTVSPLLYVQAGYEPRAVIAQTKTVKPRRLSLAERAAARREERKQRVAMRVASRSTETHSAPTPKPAEIFVVQQERVATADPSPILTLPAGSVATVEIRHDGEFAGRDWENVNITLLDVQGNTVLNPNLGKGLYLRTAYGQAEFDPPVLKEEHFKSGQATVKVLPFGRRTVVIEVQPLKALSKPMEYRP